MPLLIKRSRQVSSCLKQRLGRLQCLIILGKWDSNSLMHNCMKAEADACWFFVLQALRRYRVAQDRPLEYMLRDVFGCYPLHTLMQLQLLT